MGNLFWPGRTGVSPVRDSFARSFCIDTQSPLVKLNYYRRKGYKPYKEHIIIEKVPVQFISVYNELVKEAVKNSIERRYEKTKTKILRAEYLIAIMVQTFKPKDRERIIKLLDEAKINTVYPTKILQKHELKEKFDQFMRLYYG